MASRFSDIFKYFRYLPYLDDVVAIIEDIKDNDPPRKKVSDVIKDVLNVVVPLVKSNNSHLAKELDAAISLITQALDRWQAQESTPVPVPAEPPPPPQTGQGYDTPKEGALPDDAALKAAGYVAGDYKYSNAGNDHYMISKGVFGLASWTLVGQIG